VSILLKFFTRASTLGKYGEAATIVGGSDHGMFCQTVWMLLVCTFKGYTLIGTHYGNESELTQEEEDNGLE
jgi:hypothetical protein